MRSRLVKFALNPASWLSVKKVRTGTFSPNAGQLTYSGCFMVDIVRVLCLVSSCSRRKRRYLFRICRSCSRNCRYVQVLCCICSANLFIDGSVNRINLYAKRYDLQSNRIQFFDFPYAGVVFYAVFNELFSSQTPQGVYSTALKKCKNSPEVCDELGDSILGRGEMTSRGRARYPE